MQLHYPSSSKTPHCPSCARELSNSVSSFLLSSRSPASSSEGNADDADGERPAKKSKKDGKKDKKEKEAPYVCGHVVCKTCVDTIVRPAGRCCVCEAKVDGDGLIPVGKEGEFGSSCHTPARLQELAKLTMTGTGFAAAGGAGVKDSSAVLFRMM